jgi:hypothetical protein
VRAIAATPGGEDVSMLLVGTERHLVDLDRSFSYIDDASVTSIATGPLSRTTDGVAGSASEIWALLDGARIVTLDDAVEETHATLWAELESSDATCLATVGEASLLVGFSGAHLSLLSPGHQREPVSAFDRLDARSSWVNPASTQPDLRSIATSGQRWFANVHVGGVWRSADHGETWSEVVPAAQDVHEIVSDESGRLAAASARGFGWSAGDGESWQWTTDGLHAHYCRAVALDRGTAFVTASTGPSTADCRLYRAGVGDRFEPCGGKLPHSFPFNIETGTIAARNGAVALGTSDGRVYRSADGGDNWELIQHGIWPVTYVTFVD